MDPRVRTHAEIIADHSIDVEPGEDVLVNAPPVAEDLVVALYEVLGERGANPLWRGRSARASRARLRAVEPADLTLPTHAEALLDEADAVVGVRGRENATEHSDVPPETTAAVQRVNQPMSELMMDKRWVGTQFPAPGDAQLAEMSTAAYEDFVWDAIDKDWAAQREFQEQLVEILDPAEEVRLRSGDETDLTMSVAGMRAANDFGEKNLPGGEVYTAPVPDSVEGEVRFDVPLYHQDREVEDVYLRFSGGEVVEHAAGKNEDLLSEVLATDDGARRVGELGVGMNRDVDRFTYNMLFDEKMGDTVHLALGRALDWCVPEGREGNQSAIHLDVIVDVSEDSVLEVDGEVVQRDGAFRFEGSFEG